MTIKKQHLIFALSFLLGLTSYGQDSKTTSFINFGYDKVGSANFIKGGYKVALTDYGEWERNFSTLTADIGISPFDSKTFLAPSFTYNFYGLFYYTGLNMSYFIGDHKQDLRFAPQIGVSYFNVLNIGYSYYLPTNTRNEIKEIGRHSLNVSISLPFGLFY